MPFDAKEVQEVFLAVAGCADPSERIRLLDQKCGENLELRKRVVALLKAHDDPQDLPGLPAHTIDVEAETARSRGKVIGERYKLLEQIGEGGMGTVWVAEQTQPVRRRVALKLIKPGMDSRQVLSRFEVERQALALMDHPNIAKVLDGGMTEEGRPYFVMEYVKGVPITEYCDNARLSIADRLKLFLPVCQAVQHAHQKGIIHRDLKPSNILVCLYDGQPVPKIIDFGLAKAMHQPLTEHTLYTAHGLMVGTPLYMSPEQAEFNNLDVDTRTDIYSLGVILYELLTGATPLERQKFKDAAFQEMLRLIKEEEPLKPSMRLSTSASLPTVAAQRSLDPAQLSRTVRGDLDWIVMKALEKERSRRYETANGLAKDVERYLNDEPVQACPPSAAYRFRKFAVRNKGPVLAATSIFLLLIVGIIGTTVGLMEARRERDAAETARLDAIYAQQAEAEQRGIAQENARKAVAAAKAEEQAKETAEAREAETRAVLDFVAQKILAAARPKDEYGGLGHDVTLRQAIEAAVPFVEQNFANQPRTEARLRDTLGLSFWFLGEWRIAAEQFERALAIHTERLGREHAESIFSMNGLVLCYNELGRHAEAMQMGEEILAYRKDKLGPDHPDTLESMHNLTNSYHRLGRYADALKLSEEIVTIRKARLGADHPDTLQSIGMLGLSYSMLGRHKEAAKLHKGTLGLLRSKLGPDHRKTLWSAARLAEAYDELIRPSEAVELFEETLPLMKARLGPDHPETFRAMDKLAFNYRVLSRFDNALKVNEEKLAIQVEKLGVDHSDTLATMNDVYLGYLALNQRPKALAVSEDILAQRKAKLGSDHPDTLASMMVVAVGYAALDRNDEATKLREEAIALMKAQDGAEDPESRRMSNRVASKLNNIAWRLVILPEGESASKEAVALAKEAVELAPKSGLILNTLGAAYFRAGEWKEAIETLTRSLELQKGDNVAHDAFFIAMARWQLGDEEQARKWFNVALLSMPKDTPQNWQLRRFRAEAAELLRLPEDLPQAEVEAKNRDAKLIDLIVELEPSAPWGWHLRGAAQAEQERYNAAAADLAKAIELGEIDFRSLYMLALLHLANGDREKYQSDCAELLKRFSDTNDALTANFAAWTCALAPQAVLELEPAAELARRAVEADPDSALFVGTLGAILLRAGRLEEALEKLEQADRLAQKADERQSSPAYTWFFLAMAQQRMGHPDRAREWFDKAIEHSDKILGQHAAGNVLVPWNRRLTLHLLRTEAEELLERKTSK
jgi:serine/threonine protein kinase/tetratricopeptide (TPR) repeat protein